jgi:3-(3-hydroxy-phenyl)propionate hydroxylase
MIPIMPAHDKTPVLIVGAGPTGLVMAAQLTRLGIACEIIEKSPAPATQSRALGIQARTLEVFSMMNLADEMISLGHKVHGLSIHSDKKQLAHLRLENLDTPFPFVLVLPQSKTEQIVQTYLQNLGVSVQRRVEWLRMERRDDRVISIVKNKDGTERQIENDWLIGCDGAHSAVRHALNLSFEGGDYPETFVLADVHVNGNITEDEPRIELSPEGLTGTIPMGRGLFRIIASIQNDQSNAEPTLAEIQHLIDTRSSEPFQLSDPIWLARFHLHRRMSKKTRDGNIFIVGDAAHIHSPAGGQGMNTGIQDAFNLAWKLAAVIKNQSPISILDSYESERLPVAHAVLRGTDTLMRVVGLQNPVARYMRDHLAPLLMGIGRVKEKLRNNVAELSVEYHDSEIVEDHNCSSGPIAGDRAPDAPFRSSTLFSHFNGLHWSLLSFDASVALSPALASIVNVYQIARSTERPLHEKYSITTPCIYLIRPDGYIAFRGADDQPDLLGKYLSRIFINLEM